MRIAVCDDNKVMLDYLARRIQNILTQKQMKFEIYQYNSGNLLLHAHALEGYDVIFLDIQMPNMDGFEVASKLKEVSSKTSVIFVTSNEHLVFESFNYQPFHFIRKGLDGEMEKGIENTINLLLQKTNEHKVITLELPHSRKMSIEARSILYIESEGHYLVYHFDKLDKVKVRGTIDLIMPQMTDVGFVRVQRRFLLNIAHVKRADPSSHSLILTSGEVLKIGATYEEETNKKLLVYLRSKSY